MSKQTGGKPSDTQQTSPAEESAVSRDIGCHSSMPTPPDLTYERSVESIKSFWAWICKHPGISWALVTAFGGVTLLTYLLPVGFLPDFNLTAVVGLLALASFLGCLQLVWLGIALVAPTLMALSLVERGDDDGRASRNRRVAIVSLLGSIVWFIAFMLSIIYERVWIAYVYGVLLLIGLGLGIWISHLKSRKGDRQRWETTCQYLILFLLQGLACAISVILFIPSAGSDILGMPPWGQWAIVGLWCVLVAIFNSILLTRRIPTLGGFCAVGGALVLVLILITGNLSYVHGITVRKLHLGDIANATISVKKMGSVAIQAACRLPDAPRSCAGSEIQLPDGIAYAYSKVNILSRIGGQYYLQLCQPNEDGGPCDTVEGLRVAIEKKDVLGWSIAGNTKKRKAGEH